MFFDLFSRGKMNTDLIGGETQPYLNREEKKALRAAERAERAFRVAKGYEKERFWDRLGRKRKEGLSDYALKVTGLMRRATRRERKELARELTAHVADHASALEEQGQSPEGARQAAEAAMGDPREAAGALDALLSPFWLWIGRVCKGLCVLVCLGLVLNLNTPLFRLRYSFLVRWGTEEAVFETPESYRKGLEEEGYTLSRAVDIRGELGGNVVRVYRVFLDPAHSRAGARIVVYPQSLLGRASQETYGALKIYSQWGNGYGGSRRSLVIGAVYCGGDLVNVPVGVGDTYMTLKCERFGETLELRIPLEWEGEQ